jgi:hypothetical protein
MRVFRSASSCGAIGGTRKSHEIIMAKVRWREDVLRPAAVLLGIALDPAIGGRQHRRDLHVGRRRSDSGNE